MELKPGTGLIIIAHSGKDKQQPGTGWIFPFSVANAGNFNPPAGVPVDLGGFHLYYHNTASSELKLDNNDNKENNDNEDNPTTLNFEPVTRNFILSTPTHICRSAMGNFF